MTSFKEWLVEPKQSEEECRKERRRKLWAKVKRYSINFCLGILLFLALVSLGFTSLRIYPNPLEIIDFALELVE